MYRDYAQVSRYRRQHRREELDSPAGAERRALEIAKLIGGKRNSALRKISLGRTAGDCGRRMPQTPRVGIEGSFFLSIGGHGARAIEQVTTADTPAVQGRDHLIIRASREAMKEDRFTPQRHAQRGSAVIVGRAAAHALVLTPCSAQAFDDHASAVIKAMGIGFQGHRPNPFDVPLPRSLHSGCTPTDFLAPRVLYMFLNDSAIKDRAMTPRTLFFALACITTAFAFPVSGQEDQRAPDQEESGNSLSGVRIAQTSNGFQLIEHGLWRIPDVALRANSHIGAAPRHDLSQRDQLAAEIGTPSFRRASYLPHVYAAEAKYALPPGLLDALVWTESRYDPLAVSRVGAAGLGQLMPATARELGVANRFDPVANIDGAARYLRQMLDRFGVVHLALAAYNAGPGAVSKAGGIPRNGETPAYVRNVLRRWTL